MDSNELCSAVESILFAAESPISVKRLQEVFTEVEEGAEPAKPAKAAKSKTKKAAPREDTDEGGEAEAKAGDETSEAEEIETEVEAAEPEAEPQPVELFPADAIEQALTTLMERYAGEDRGFELRKANNGYHFVTKPANVKWVQKFLATKPFRLGKSALEVMSIVAYRQPVTRADIDKIRGIDSGHLLRVLMERGLVKMAGKAEVPGRPVQYATTPKFLETVGLADLNELPPLSELTELQGEKPTKDPLEEGLERFVRSTEDPEKLEEASQEELAEINEMISEAEALKDVYESPVHADVASANIEAHEAALSSKKRRAKDTKAEVVRPDDEVPSDDAEVEASPEASEEPAEREMSYEELVSDMEEDEAPVSALEDAAGPVSFDADEAARAFDAEEEEALPPSEPEETDSELIN